MMRCESCHGTLKRDETKCFICGTAVPPEKNAVTLRDRFRVLVRYAFFFSSILTVASLFTDYAPPFIKCVLATVILLLVKNSADQMRETQ
jgi:hypothetical protein